VVSKKLGGCVFSGIVEEVGEVVEIRDTEGGRWLKIKAADILKDGAI
jgi:riboflavin synthase alpha subunit